MYWLTFPIMTLAAFHDLSFGILLAGARRTITAAVTLTTAGGGLPKDFNSVRLAWGRIIWYYDVGEDHGAPSSL